MSSHSKSLLYFHQGWTDIVNCLPLIHYYSHCKPNLEVIVRIDARDFIEYTCRGLTNVSFIYVDKLILDNTVDFSKLIPEYEEYEILFHGGHDIMRNDSFKGIWGQNASDKSHFVKKFYKLYNISIEDSISLFNYERDLNAENELFYSFQNIIKKPYVIFHEPWDFDLNVKFRNINSINVNGLSLNPFLWIQVLQSANELHLVDSFWASVYYLICYKFDINDNQKVIIYPFNRDGGLWSKRDNRELFHNWKFKEKKCIF